jgi:predicted membrane metal-binding protein
MSLQQKKLMFDLRGYFLVAIVAAWLVGILLASTLVLSSLALLASAGIFGLLIIVFYQDRQMRFIMLLAFCACLGAWRYRAVLPSNDAHSITTFIGPALEVSGTVANEPQVGSRTRLLLVDANEVSQDDGNDWKEAHGQLEVQTLDTSLEDPYGANYGDSVELRGKLQPPSPDSPPGIFASMLFPSVSVTDTGGNPIIAFLYHLRATFATVIEQALPQPAAAVLIAIVLGLQTPGLQSLKSAFSLTGTIHLTVSSGFKVTILAGLVASSTGLFYRRRKARLLPAQRLPFSVSLFNVYSFLLHKLCIIPA